MLELILSVATLLTVILVVAQGWRIAGERDEQRRLRLELGQAVCRLVDAVGHREPTRQDADDALRLRNVFCGRLIERGHDPECPWQAIVRRFP